MAAVLAGRLLCCRPPDNLNGSSQVVMGDARDDRPLDLDLPSITKSIRNRGTHQTP